MGVADSRRGMGANLYHSTPLLEEPSVPRDLQCLDSNYEFVHSAPEIDVLACVCVHVRCIVFPCVWRTRRFVLFEDSRRHDRLMLRDYNIASRPLEFSCRVR